MSGKCRRRLMPLIFHGQWEENCCAPDDGNPMHQQMNDDEKYLFDLNGYLILRDVVDPDIIRRCNEAVDEHDDQIPAAERVFEGEAKALASDIRQRWTDDMLEWGKPWREGFLDLLTLPSLAPYLSEILGSYRMAHPPRLLMMDPGCAGHYLHGGRLDRQSFKSTYMAKFGRIYSSLVIVEFPLAEEGPGDGGLALVAGGHKANFPIPPALRDWEAYRDHVVEVHVKPGDAVIFNEITIHGTLLWRGEHQRRALLYHYSPAYQASQPLYEDITYPDYVSDMTPEQQEMLRPPHG